MKQATAKRGFKRSDTKVYVRRGETITGPDKYIDELAQNGLVVDTKSKPGAPETKANPSKADGAAKKSSASPAAPASKQTTAKKSDGGAKSDPAGE
ncbi:hypothetical protein [Lysobacter sp. F6437]|uniref:hypothetical protein n=1 Tax=Lysobacter sp. F6437 TaxID=3459296 RepID=UPI00403D9B5A